MEKNLKSDLLLLSRIFPNDTLELPFKASKDKSYTIEYFKTISSLSDSLGASSRWRLVDHNAKVLVAPSNVNELVKLMQKLEIDLEKVRSVVNHHLVLSVSWHTYCIEHIKAIKGEDYIEKSEKEKGEIVDKLSILVQDLMSGEDVKKELGEALLMGVFKTAPKLSLVEETPDE